MDVTGTDGGHVATGWRQGDILPCTIHGEISKIVNCALTESDACIVVTHSCELVKPGETFEIVIGRPTGQKKPNSGYTWARSRRRLEIRLSNLEQIVPIGINELDRHHLPIRILEKARPDERVLSDDTQREALIEWLVARYARPGFANAFEHRVGPVVKYLAEVAGKFQHVWRIYLDLDSWDEGGFNFEVQPRCGAIVAVS